MQPMRPPLTIDFTAGYENFETLDLTIKIRVPVANFFESATPSDSAKSPASSTSTESTTSTEPNESTELVSTSGDPASDGGPACSANSEQPVISRASIDFQIEQIRRRMSQGVASKDDEDNLVVFRLLQALGFEYWPIDRSDP